jgi:ankyrin repeat protein
MICAAYNGNYDIVYSLLEVNAKPYKPNHDGQTPLMIAQRKGHTQIVQLLHEADKVNLKYKVNSIFMF